MMDLENFYFHDLLALKYFILPYMVVQTSSYTTS